ncbi:MAG: hypothetical protein ACM3KS_00165 [Phycisphaerales bacterium]
MVIVALLALIPTFSVASANPAIKEPVQDSDFVNDLKVVGTGTIDVWTSVVDKTIALEYYSSLQGDGDIEMDTGSATAERSENIHGCLNGTSVPLNLYQTASITYSGKTPLVGIKHIKSNSFYGGIGAEINEYFSVTELERVDKTFFASTDPASYMTDPKKIAQALGVSPVHSVGAETKQSFNGTWITDSKMHKIFSKDVKIHEAFAGKYDVQKMLKFHENPSAEKLEKACDDIDC